MQRLVIATDGSAGAKAAVETGVDLASKLGASVMFVYVRPALPPVLGQPNYQRKLSEQLAGARGALEEAMEVARERGVDAEEDILEGDAATQIIQAARHHGADLITIGSRGLGTMAGALLGSVSLAVAHHAPCPVLVVRRDEG